MKITVKQQQILTFIREFEKREHMAPTVYEIAEHIGITTPTVFVHIRSLKRKGKLTRSAKARSIKLIDEPPPKVAVWHTVIFPSADASEPTGELAGDRKLLGSGNHDFFALRVPDNSMSEFGIFIDDEVIIRQTDKFNPGDLVVVIINDKNQIRSAYLKPQGQIELRPANPEFKTQVFPATEITIRGVVVALQREY